MTMRLNTEFDNVTGREDRDRVTGDQIHAWKCIKEILNDGTKETGFLIHCIIVQVREAVHNGTRGTGFLILNVKVWSRGSPHALLQVPRWTPRPF